jgi:hypothetical protein
MDRMIVLPLLWQVLMSSLLRSVVTLPGIVGWCVPDFGAVLEVGALEGLALFAGGGEVVVGGPALAVDCHHEGEDDDLARLGCIYGNVRKTAYIDVLV